MTSNSGEDMGNVEQLFITGENSCYNHFAYQNRGLLKKLQLNYFII